MLSDTAYGKQRIRLVRVARHGDRHDLRDLTVGVRFEGAYDASYVDGSNADVLPTDTMKNTVYALASQELDEPESFGLRLAEHFLGRNPELRRVRIDLTEHQWRPIAIGEKEHGSTFMRRGPDARSARVTADREAPVVEAGVADLLILKSSHSAFSGFRRDELTTLPETRDRILATSLTANWRYHNADLDFGPTWRAVRALLLETFARHDSESVQHTLYAMGQAVIDNVDHVDAITLVMPNRHHLPFDLSRVGLENRNEIFIATEEPHGLIEATIRRA